MNANTYDLQINQSLIMANKNNEERLGMTLKQIESKVPKPYPVIINMGQWNEHNMRLDEAIRMAKPTTRKENPRWGKAVVWTKRFLLNCIEI